MAVTCPAGHRSESEDYCDVCGIPIGAPSAGPEAPASPSSAPSPSGPAAPDAPPAPVAVVACPSCGVENPADALFCEACGYDFTTGTMPRSAPAAASSVPADPSPATPPSPAAPVAALVWVAEVWIDPDWYAEQVSPDPLPSPGLPTIVPLRASSLLIGRPSRSRSIHPDVDCGLDSGTSRRQAQLTTDGTRWWVEDLGSANGTFVGPASGPLPADPIPLGPKRELDDDDRIYVGAWTRIVVRRATEDEVSGGT